MTDEDMLEVVRASWRRITPEESRAIQDLPNVADTIRAIGDVVVEMSYDEAQAETLVEALTKITTEADSYVGIGHAVSDEDAGLVAAIASARAVLSDTSATARARDEKLRHDERERVGEWVRHYGQVQSNPSLQQFAADIAALVPALKLTDDGKLSVLDGGDEK